jgi:hypothetical protein
MAGNGLSSFLRLKIFFNLSSFSKTEILRFVTRADNKEEIFVYKIKEYCIQNWGEKMLLTAKAFRVFT